MKRTKNIRPKSKSAEGKSVKAMSQKEIAYYIEKIKAI